MPKGYYEVRIFLTFFFIYSFFIYWSTWNEESFFALVRAIVEENRFEIDSFQNQTGDRVYHAGHVYSQDTPGLPFLSSFIYKLWKDVYFNFFPKWFKEVHKGSSDYLVEKPFLALRIISPGFFILTSMILLTTLTSSLFSALSVVLVYKISEFFIKNNATRLFLTIVYGLGTSIFPYSLTFQSEAVSTFLTFLAFYILFINKQREERKIFHTNFSSGIFLGYSVVTNPFVILTVPLLSAYCFYSFKKKENKLSFIFGILLGILPLLIYNHFVFSNVFNTFSYYSSTIFRLFLFKLSSIGYGELIPFNRYFAGLDYNIHVIFMRLLFYPARGLFFHYPILLFSLLGLYFMKKKFKAEAILIISIFLVFVIANSLYFSWSGGLCFGPRYLAPLAPFLSLPLAFIFKKNLIKYLLFFACLSIFTNFLGLQTLAPFLPNLPTPPIISQLNSFEILKNPLKEHYIPLFFKNGPRSRIFEEIISGKVEVDIRHWSPQFGTADQYLKFYKIDLLSSNYLKIALRVPFLSMIPVTLVTFLLWGKEIFQNKHVRKILMKDEFVFILTILFLLLFLSFIEIQ
ncbi:MAG: hypothetical protein QW040_01780 [Candidatus Aenigmatarchaeota archaeon]